jgi:hypothetical protein
MRTATPANGPTDLQAVWHRIPGATESKILQHAMRRSPQPQTAYLEDMCGLWPAVRDRAER